MSYEVTNVSGGSIMENLDTKDARGNLEVLSLGQRDKTVLTDEQFASRRVQTHVLHKRLRTRKIEAPATAEG